MVTGWSVMRHKLQERFAVKDQKLVVGMGAFKTMQYFLKGNINILEGLCPLKRYASIWLEGIKLLCKQGHYPNVRFC